MSDLQVSVAFVVENQEQLARALEQAGGKIGSGFGANLSAEAQRHLDQLTRAAEQAAKDVGATFNRKDLTFRTAQGKFFSTEALDQLSKANKGFAEARAAVETLRQAMNRMGQEGQRSFNLLESAIEGVAISLTGRLTDSITSSLQRLQGLVTGFLELDKQLRLAAAAAGEQGAYQRLGTVVDKVGIDAAGTSQQVAELATSLVRAGFSVSEVEGALAGVVRGAEATGTGFEQFGEIVGNTLRGFGLEVDQTARVVDVLVNTANSSNASIQGLGYTFEYTAPIAKALGVSLEDVAAAAGLMANAGIQGSVAGTGLRTGLQKLQQAAGGATPEVLGLVRGQERLQNVMKKLGATITDSNGKLLPLEQVFQRLKAGLEKLNQADQVQLANILFGDEAGSKFLSVTNQSSAAISKMFADIRRSTGAADTAREAMAGMGLEVQQLQGTVDSLGKTIGGVIAAGLRPLVGLANAAAGAISGLPGPVKTTGAALIGLGAAATAASVGIAALNLALAQTGGFAALASGAKLASLAVAGVGANLVVVAGAAAGIGLLTGAFGEMDRTTKTLVQTTVALGGAVLAFRVVRGLIQLATAAAALYNVQLTRTAILTALAAGGARGGIAGALISAAAAAGVAALAYKMVGDNVKEAGQDTAELSDKARELKEQIAQLQKEVADGKKLGIDTSDSQRRINEIYMKLREIETPLELKLSAEKIKSEIKGLKDELGKLPEGDRRSSPLEARLNGAERYLKLLQQISQKQAVTDASPIAQQGAKDLAELERRVNQLLARKITLSVDAPEQKQIDKELDIYQRQIDLRKTGIRVIIDREEAMRQLSALQGEIAAALSKGADPSKLQSRLLPLQIQIRNLDIERDKINKDLLATLGQQVTKSSKKALTAKEERDIAKSKLEVEQMALRVGQEQLGIDQGRLALISQYVSAVQSYIAAQRDLQQSGFDVQSSRVGGRIQAAERELALMRERGAGAQQIADQEAYIRDLREQARQIDIQSTAARLQGLAESFQIERQVLEIKQIQAQLEQGAATQGARSNVLQQKQTLLELEGKLADPSLTEPQKQALREQIAIQRDLIGIANERLGFEQTRSQILGVTQGLERETLKTQQQATVNRERANAAAKEYEDILGKQLNALSMAAGAADSVATKQRVFVGEISTAGQPAVKLYDEIERLAEPIKANTDRVKEMTSALAAAVEQAQRLAGAMGGGKALQPRWAGGDAVPGQDYQVNELGTESFLTRSGTLSLITAPRYGRWSPPAPGVVLPAHVTRHLQARGAFEGRSGGLPRAAAAAIGPAVTRGGPDFVPLQRSIDRLDHTIRTHRPVVEVSVPGNAGLLHTLQSIR